MMMVIMPRERPHIIANKIRENILNERERERERERTKLLTCIASTRGLYFWDNRAHV